MEISYQLTTDDYRQGFKAFRTKTTIWRWAYHFIYAGFFIALAAALLLLLFGSKRSLPFVFPLLGGAAFWAWWLWYFPYHVANKMIYGSPTASLPHTVAISESGLHTRTSATEGRLAWDAFIGWEEAERVFALFPSPISFFPIPKRAMTGEQQNEFRTLLRSKIQRRK